MSLADLLAQSRTLTTHLSKPDLPQIHLGLDQIENQSKKLVHKQRGDINSRAHYLLASGGLNASDLSSKIFNVNSNLNSTFEPLQPLHDNDVQGYLRHDYEQTIISAIEEGRRDTLNDFHDNLATNMQTSWDKRKAAIFEELGQHATGIAPTMDYLPESSLSASVHASIPSTSLAMNTRMNSYVNVVKKLNEYRLQGYNYGLISEFANVAKSLSTTDSRSNQVHDCWNLLASSLREKSVVNGEFQRAALSEREYAHAYLFESVESESARNLRTMWTNGSKRFLEHQFLKYIEKIIVQNPSQAQVGGVPLIQNKVRGFLNVKYRKNGGWSDPKIEIISGQPIWAMLFTLLRTGHAQEALELATESEEALGKTEREFVPYFKAWLDSPDQRLPKQLRDRFMSTYNTRIRFAAESGSIDPYKHALYKLVGRAELSRRNLPSVTNTTEDWLWLQLSLVRESSPGEDTPSESFGLRELAGLLLKFGEKHFDPKGNNPIKYFTVLLLCGQFERAVGYLYNNLQYQVDAVQFAVALSYYGLLRAPEKSHTSEIELLTSDANGQPALDFARIIHRYTRIFARSDPQEALQYLYLICLNSDAPQPISRQQIALCHAYIKDLVLETRSYAHLLGEVKPDGTKTQGLIERDLKLIKLDDERDYLLNIVKSAASRAELEKRTKDAILLYNLAEEYDVVVTVLCRELGASLSVNPAPQNDDIFDLARGILDHYKRDARIAHRVSQKNRETVGVLLRLKEALTLYEQSQLDAALSTIEDVKLIPLNGDVISITRKSEEFKDLDESISRNLSDVLLITMNILFKIHANLKESPFGDSSRQNKMSQLRAKARTLMMFVGLLRFRISSDVLQQLSRLDVMMV
ncbi:NIC-domain-containing protein [Wallemia mellicola]|uniref:Nuclear pore protein n=1 Tax=Wallemia mellicola TaxID=1708541 RepID=A0A4V4MMF6_9BASI|nr:NIC-domain-containing protein [Wallemia mellicola]